MSSDFCVQCDNELSAYCEKCVYDLCKALERAERERDTLVRMLVSEFGWEDTSYLHAMMHVENAVRNLRTDLSVAEEERDDARAQLEGQGTGLTALDMLLDHPEHGLVEAVRRLKADRDLARELLANVFDRYACAACSHGKTGPECPCGFHAAGAYLDRTEKP